MTLISLVNENFKHYCDINHVGIQNYTSSTYMRENVIHYKSTLVLVFFYVCCSLFKNTFTHYP